MDIPLRSAALKINIAILIVVVAAGCGREKEGVRPTVKPLMEAIYASGFVVSKDEYQIFAQAEGYVSDKLVADGETVKKGQALYVIASDQAPARYRIARETFDLATKNYQDDSPVLRELTAALETSKARKQFDSVNFVRYTSLLKNNATSRNEYDRIKLAHENSSNEYALQRSRFERTKNQLHLELENARNQLVIAGDETGRHIIKSEVDGMVYMMAKEKGELIRRSELVAVVGKKDAYYLQLNVDELDVQRILPGQEVLVKIDAYPDKLFNASVTKVFPMVDRRQQSVRVDAALKDTLPGLFSGLALEANIVIRKKDNAIVIPKSKLLPGDSVMIHSDKGEEKIKVTVGIQTLDEVEIIEGLDTSRLLVENK